MVAERLQADQLEQRVGPLSTLRLRDVRHPGTELDVAPHAQPREQVRLLEHDAPVGIGTDDGFAADGDVAGGRNEEAGKDVEEGGLPAARRTGERHELTRLDDPGRRDRRPPPCRVPTRRVADARQRHPGGPG